MDINEPCRVSIDEAAYDYPEKPVRSIFLHADLVAELDDPCIEEKRKLLNNRDRAIEELNEKNRKYVAAEIKIKADIEGGL